MKRIFISRDLEPGSFFRVKLERAGFEVCGESLVRFSPVNFSVVPVSDWIFFYSRQAVKYFFVGLEQAGLTMPIALLAALGRGTARQLESLAHAPHFVGDGNPVSTARSFLAVAKGRRVLFPRAARSRRSIQELLKGEILVEEMVVYENEIKRDIDLPPAAILVFTSPLNAEAYFGKNRPEKGQRVYAIGRTTAGYLESIGISDIRVSPKPSEEALAEMIIHDREKDWQIK